MNATVMLLLLVLLRCFLACGGGLPLKLAGNTTRNYTFASNHTLANVPNERPSNSSNIVTIFCVKATCTDGSRCYCCNSSRPQLCYDSWAQCWAKCRRCAPSLGAHRRDHCHHQMAMHRCQ
ncbi:hypothetical protein BDA96_06G260900 [Sorghum bicolor]|uniref:Embryo surrounding factor 1 brassicaceae domain-containing protein n=1 Tax=Sorghum bicolor TaxID=4558 RepID=A0A921UER1_SORBI|nr:hypothetical protein BDA96_06G260900 [Sorghum bicolor]